ncbi:hypothetical protein BGZ72_007667 [Mortierella alpina]|nr:hypothetical protein BGZ72_007667 [Mortierella alpina]
MFSSDHKSHTLLAPHALKLVQISIKNAQESSEPSIQLALCEYIDTLLAQMKRTVKPPSNTTPITADSDQDHHHALGREMAQAYLDHANLIADLGYPDRAKKSRRRAEKWGPSLVEKDAWMATKSSSCDRKQMVDVATVSDSIFPVDVAPPALPWTFPDPDTRLADTPQLASCLGLLRQGSASLLPDALDPVANRWLLDTERNGDEKARLESLATDIIRAFTRDEIKDKKAIAEVLCLVPVLGEDDFRFLLSLFLNNIEGSRILDIGALRGLAQLLQNAAPGYLHAQDLIEVLSPMSIRLQETHSQSPDHIFELAVAVSAVLDAMADTKVTSLKRVELHEPLLAFLSGLQGTREPHLKFYAAYAYQALLCVPDDESPWQATVRRTTKVVKGISGLVSAVKGLDLNGFMSGLQNMQEGFEGVQQIFKLTKAAYEGLGAIYEGEQDLMASLKEGLSFNRKRAWYSALRGADVLIEGGEIAKFRVLVCKAPCRRELAFQWGVCQRLAGLAANPLWDIETRRGAFQFLAELYRNDSVWGQHPPIKAYILGLLKQLSKTDKELLEATLLLNDLALNGDATKQDIYRASMAKESGQGFIFNSGLPILASPSLLDRVQKRTDVEADLRRIARHRFKERGGTVYIPPLAKHNLQSTDDALFPLIPMVDDFLQGSKKVLLLLGDSGVGKTAFNRELDFRLWKSYKAKKGRIPLMISLPAIDRPAKDLIPKHLRTNDFSEPQIRELKNREFIIICDGYDESQQTQNLYESNGWNKEGGWKVQVILSCRSDHVGQDYQDLFRPSSSASTAGQLFQQAVLVPFSMSQVKEYIDQYVDTQQPVWAAADYKSVLDQIPSLQDLVTNPFLLTLSLDVLPRLADPGQRLTARKITRVQLYDEFVIQWLERNKKRLAAQEMSDEEQKAFESLSDDGFTHHGLAYLKKLSAAIYHEQGANPVVNYSKLRDRGTWKEYFFSRKDEEVQLLRRALPVTRNGSRFGFIHRSILEYGISLAIYEPIHHSGLQLEVDEEDTQQHHRRKSVGTVYSFEIESPIHAATVSTATIAGPDLESPLAKRNFIKDPSVLQFLVERVQTEPIFKDQLMAYIEASKADKKWRIGAANAITILVRAGVHFSQCDLQGIQIPGADLSFGVFDSAILRGADLRKTSLQSAWLRKSDLSHARMDAVHFGEWPALKKDQYASAISFSDDGRTLVAGTIDGKMVVYDTSTWAIAIPLERNYSDTPHLYHQALSSSGIVAAAGIVPEVRLWDTKTGRLLHTLLHEFNGEKEDVLGIAISPDACSLATVSSGPSMRLWNVVTGVVEHLVVPPERQESVAYGPDGTIIATFQEDGTIRIWDTPSLTCRHVFQGCENMHEALAFSASGDRIAVPVSDGMIKIYDIISGECIQQLSKHAGSVNIIKFSHMSDVLVSTCSEEELRIWNLRTGHGQTLIDHSGALYGVAFSPDNEQVATAGADKTIRLWDIKTGSPGPVLYGHSSTVISLRYSPDGAQIASSSHDRTIRLWNIRRQQQHQQQLQSQQQSSRHVLAVDQVICLPAGHHIASRCTDSVRIWEMETGRTIQSRDVSVPTIMEASPCGQGLATQSITDRTIKIWDVPTGRCLFEWNTDPVTVHCAGFSCDGTRIGFGGFDGELEIWNWRTGLMEQHVQTASDFFVEKILFSPTRGAQLAVVGGEAALWLYDVQTDQRTHLLSHAEFGNPNVTALTFSQDGTVLYAFFAAGTIRAWDATTGQCVSTLDTECGKSLLMSSPGGSSDGRGVFFVGCDHTLDRVSDEDEQALASNCLHIWDLVEGKRLHVLHLPASASGPNCVAFSPDHQWLTTAAEDQVVRLWDMTTGEEIGRLDCGVGGLKSFSWDPVVSSSSSCDEQPSRSLVIGGADGDVSAWNILETVDSTEEGEAIRYRSSRTLVNMQEVQDDDSTVGTHVIDRHPQASIGDTDNSVVFVAKFEFKLKWSSGYGKLNAEGAMISGVKGLSRANSQLLKQNGAVGREERAALSAGVRQVAHKVLGSRSVLAQLKGRSMITPENNLQVKETEHKIFDEDRKEE